MFTPKKNTKSNQKKTVSTTIDDDTHSEVRKIAKENNITVSKLIEQMIVYCLNQETSHA